MCLPCTHVVHMCFSVLKSDRQAANYNKEVGHVSLLRVFDIGFKMSVYLKLTLSHSLFLSLLSLSLVGKNNLIQLNKVKDIKVLTYFNICVC